MRRHSLSPTALISRNSSVPGTRAGMSPEVKPAPAMDQSEFREALTALDEAVLAKMRAHLSLREILTELCVQIERICPGLLCSVLLLDADGKTLHSAAAPSIS